MGSQPICACLDDERDENQEFRIGTGVYSFKKIVRKIINNNNLVFF